MQTETTGISATVSLPMLLIAGWAVVVLLAVYGAWQRSTRLLSWGIVGVGLMILVSPLAWYLYTASRPDLFSIGVFDVLILGLLAFVGGGVAVSGLTLPSRRASPAAKR